MREVNAAGVHPGGGGGCQWGATVGGGQRWGRGVSGCTGPLRPECCAEVWNRGLSKWADVGGECRGQPLITAFYTISMSLQNIFCESHTWSSELKGSMSINALWALSVNPVFAEKSKKGLQIA